MSNVLKINTDRIEIDLTHDCDRGCQHCDRLCDVAPEPFLLDLGVLRKFVADSLRMGKQWKSIDVGGGAVEKHPQAIEVFDIIAPLNAYCQHVYVGGGLSDEFNKRLPHCTFRDVERQHFDESYDQRPHDIKIPVMMSPTDLNVFYPNAIACWRPWDHGMCLNKNGFFACAVGGAIDRVLGLGLGVANIEHATEAELVRRAELLCAHCGGYLSSWGYLNSGVRLPKPPMTPTWRKALSGRAFRPRTPPPETFPIHTFKLELEITFACNLACGNCSRCCGQTNRADAMTLAEVSRFVDESIDLRWPWQNLCLSGGECTLHPDFIPIVRELERLKAGTPGMDLTIQSNRHSEFSTGRVAEATASGQWRVFRDKWPGKKDSLQWHQPTCVSPEELGIYDGLQFCETTMFCGIALSRYGYTFCATASAINRIFGLGLGIPSLAEMSRERLLAQAEATCRHCGEYIRQRGLFKPIQAADTITDSLWKRKIAEYNAAGRPPKKA